jgi:hypothetical protein
MEIITLLFTGFLLNHCYIVCSTMLVLIFRKLPIYRFDSSSDPINSEDLLKEIKKNNSFMVGYTFKEGIRKPEGLFYNWEKGYIGYIENYQISNNFTTKIQSKITFVGKLPIEIKCLHKPTEIDTDKDEDETKSTFIKIFLNSNYYEGNFKEIALDFEFNPKVSQTTLMNNIVVSYESNPFHICRTLIWGEPGGGKSFIGKLLARKYQSAYCFDIKLLDPGTPILDLWQTVMPSKDKPLIIQIDEFDIIINKIHNTSKHHESTKPHQWLRTMIADKQSYNTFLSEYLICLPYVIYLFTMNSKPEDIIELDASYIRKNRIDLILQLVNPKDKKHD